MKRRGFLGMFAGAAVAGPSMAKQAVAQSIGDLRLDGIASGSEFFGAVPTSPFNDNSTWETGRLAKLLGRSAASHAFKKRSLHIDGLDPDIASYRSISLDAKMRMQRERMYWRELEREKTWLEGRILGWLNDD